MALLTLFVVVSVRDVVLVMIDIAIMFEGVAARLDRPDPAADGTPQFALHASPTRISVPDALCYSAATIATLGPDSETQPRDRHSQRPPHDPV